MCYANVTINKNFVQSTSESVYVKQDKTPKEDKQNRQVESNSELLTKNSAIIDIMQNFHKGKKIYPQNEILEYLSRIGKKYFDCMDNDDVERLVIRRDGKVIHSYKEKPGVYLIDPQVLE